MAIDFEKGKTELNAAIKNALLQFCLELTGNIQRLTPIATGTLGGSFSPMVGRPLESGIAVGAVGSPVWDSYGSYVEFGTKPHWAPIQPLIDWAHEKFAQLAIGVSFESGRATPTKRGTIKTPEARIISIAYAIRAKIAKVGTEPKLYVKRAIDQMGCPSIEVHDELGSYYSVDPTPWLEGKTLL